MAVLSLNRSGDQAAGARPEALSPCSLLPSQIREKPSPPIPFMVGSTTVNVMAAAIAASIALPPRANTAAPAWAARGWEVDTMLRPSTGCRPEGYGSCQFMKGDVLKNLDIELCVYLMPLS